MIYNVISKKDTTYFTICESFKGLDDFAFELGWRISRQIQSNKSATDLAIELYSNFPSYVEYDTWKNSLNLKQFGFGA